MTATVPVRLVRDRSTWLVYLQLGVFATYLYGLSAALPLLRIDQGLSQAVAGLHGTSMAVGGILTGLALPRLTARIGRHAVVWTGMAGMSAGTFLVAAAPTFLPATLLGYGVASGMASLTMYTGMASLDDRHGPAGPAAISEANAVCVIVGIGVPFVVSVAAQSTLGWRAALVVPTVLTVLLALFMGRVRVPERPAAAEAGPVPPRVDASPGVDTSPGDGARLGRRFRLAGIVLFCCVAAEFCFNLWAAKLFADRTGLSPAVAATAVAAFTAGMAAGRLAGGWLALRIAPTVLFTGALLVAATGWGVFWLSTEPAFSYAGLALSGVGVALHFPMALSRLLAVSGGRRNQAAAIASIITSVALGLGPFVLGALADGFGIRTAFLLVPTLIGAALAGLLIGTAGDAPALSRPSPSRSRRRSS
ncbi:MFS transporter [Streptosporangium longisporum]|uniref:Major facilitator superfamily (MFS) profile domain-containing protein n=1 Tax=Streptosporangium longisporum TaxID=46187 RepID=A0ABN3YED7_9ACTN